ncbi:hypothetical protein SAY86_023145 [Trapa natans]|uniref:Uncharacterized protein n=1 Tax=Trapa natans TaxID=22666 RepID=A0AAN7R934_TRANT|nr:hypothetical protein SAY86_023145 [Trapa natans]
MGHCISKCIPSSSSSGGGHFKFELDDHDDHAQDKLVISQQASSPPFKFRTPPWSLSSKVSSSSSSPSFKFATESNSSRSSRSTGSCSSSSLSTASSGVSTKDRSFSNDFLLSCIKENPQILRIPVLSSPNRIRQTRGGGKKMSPGPSAQKRVRSGSPNLTRQKSMRFTYYNHQQAAKIFRSPSPSRRFEGGGGGGDHRSRRTLPITATSREVISGGAMGSMTPSNGRRKDHTRPLSSNRYSAGTREITSKFWSPHHHAMDLPSWSHDINDPLISLDCFIFL